MKALWPRLVPDGTTLGTAYAAESLIQQVLLLVAPLLAAALLTWSGPAAALWTAAAATLFGTVAFVSAGAGLDDGTPPAEHGTGSAFGVPEIRVLLAATAVQGLIFGALPVVLYGLAARAGTPATGALLLAAWVGGGVSGSFRRSDADYPRALTWLAGALAVPALATAVTGGSLIAAAVTFAVAGLFLTPVAAASYVLVADPAPPARRIETFTWMSTALAVGGSAGSALAGFAVARRGVVPAMFLPMLAAGSATAIAAVLRRERGATGRSGRARP